MTYFFPFGTPFVVESASFADLSVTASYAFTALTSSNAVSVEYLQPGDTTLCTCPAGYIPCPGLTVPGYALVCLEVKTCGVGETLACPESIPVPTTTTTSTTSTTTTSTTSTTTSTSTTTTTKYCVAAFDVDGPELTSTAACGLTGFPFTIYTDGPLYYTDPSCESSVYPGFYKTDSDEWIEIDGSSQLINGPTACIPSTTTTAAPICPTEICLTNEECSPCNYCCDGGCSSTPCPTTTTTTSTTTTAAPTTTTTTTCGNNEECQCYEYTHTDGTCTLIYDLCNVGSTTLNINPVDIGTTFTVCVGSGGITSDSCGFVGNGCGCKCTGCTPGDNCITTTTTTSGPTTTTTSTTTTINCVFQYDVTGPEASSTAACALLDAANYSVYYDGVSYFSDGVCTKLMGTGTAPTNAPAGFYKRDSDDYWIEFSGGTIVSGPTDCNATTTTTSTTTTGAPGTCYTAVNNGGGESGTVYWTNPTTGAESTTIAAGNSIFICSNTTPYESPAADVVFYNCGNSCTTDISCPDCEEVTTTTTEPPVTTTTTSTTTTSTTTIAPGTFINLYSTYQSSPPSNCGSSLDDQYLLTAELVNSVGTPINNTTGNNIVVVVEYNEQNSCNSTNINSTDTLTILPGTSSDNLVYYTTINDDCGTPPNCNGTIIKSYTCITSVTNSYATGSASELNYCPP